MILDMKYVNLKNLFRKKIKWNSPFLSLILLDIDLKTPLISVDAAVEFG